MTPIEFITEELELPVVGLLGSGFHGMVFEIDSPIPQAIKLTSDYTEASCVIALQDTKRTNPHLPIIYAYGDIKTPVYLRVGWQGEYWEDKANFWYLKEMVAPLPYAYPAGLEIEEGDFGLPIDPWWTPNTGTPKEENLKKRVFHAVKSLQQSGIYPEDAWNLKNWGYRPETDTLVYIDLSCEVGRKKFWGLF